MCPPKASSATPPMKKGSVCVRAAAGTATTANTISAARMNRSLKGSRVLHFRLFREQLDRDLEHAPVPEQEVRCAGSGPPAPQPAAPESPRRSAHNRGVGPAHLGLGRIDADARCCALGRTRRRHLDDPPEPEADPDP